jgi:hypothetical protein
MIICCRLILEIPSVVCVFEEISSLLIENAFAYETSHAFIELSLSSVLYTYLIFYNRGNILLFFLAFILSYTSLN